MQPFNNAWKTRIDKAVKENALGMSYLDVWPLSLQRGDSHLLPPTECLHFCTKGVVEEWQQVCIAARAGVLCESLLIVPST